MGGMPRGGSQVGSVVMVAAESVLEDEGKVCVLEALSQRMKRAGRSSMAVGAAAASLAFEGTPEDRRMAIDIPALRESLNEVSGSLARWVSGPQQAADYFTKGLGDEGLRVALKLFR